MAVETKATKLPIQAFFRPRAFKNTPVTPILYFLPKAYSAMIKGMLHRKRQMIHASKKAPDPSIPPFCAAIRGNRQILPVPTAMPRALSRNPILEENRCCSDWSMRQNFYNDIKWKAGNHISGSNILSSCFCQLSTILTFGPYP